jgi:hypothetical protein
MSDRQWIILNHLGGAEWLRNLLDKKDPFPKIYYDEVLKTVGTNAVRKQTPPIQERI